MRQKGLDEPVEDELILHNYPLSPFSEKVRAMLGYANLPWHSVRTTASPPRPFIDLLAGGYRRIPVAQIGADIFCDTRTITTEVARLSGRPELALEGCPPEVVEFVEEVEPVIFFACVMSASGTGLMRRLWADLRLSELMNALRDRMSMNRGMKIRTASPRRAPAVARDFCARLEGRLDEGFLFGGAPNVGDFSAYHCLWFVRDVGGRKWVRKYPAVLRWMDRIRAFGHGRPREMDGLEALEGARHCEPAPLPTPAGDDPLMGKRVIIAPVDYALDGTAGTLVAATERTWILARETAKTGLLHVHFPRHGYELSSER